MKLSTKVPATARVMATLAFAFIAILPIATPRHVHAFSADDNDEDGIAAAVDACPDTDPADLVGPDGCVIASCESGLDGSGWSSRRAYVAYVTSWAKGAKAAGTMTGREVRTLVRRARNSTCGSPELVRCCVFADFADDVGRCRIITEGACDALDDRLYESDGESDEEGAGSCLPNPCLF